MNIPEAQLDHEPPPSSQLVSPIFFDPSNQALKIFIEAAQVLNRPKLIRRLRSGGAIVCDQVGEAQIILVDPDTESGSQLIENWAGEKVVLDCGWVQSSIERGRAHLADEGWGGFSAGSTAGGSAQRSETTQNHLPTPRETPSEPKPVTVMQNQQSHPPGPAQGVSSPPSGFPYQQQMLPNSQPVGTPMNMVPPNFLTVDANMMAQMIAYMQQQQGMNPAAIGMSQMSQVPNQHQLPMNMLQGQALPPSFPQQSMPFISSRNMYAQPSFHHPQQHAAFPHQMVNMPFQQTVDASAMRNGQSYHSASPDVQRHSSISESYRGSPMQEDEAPSSLKRKKRAADASTLSTSKKKSKSRREERPKHRRCSDPDDEPALPYADSTPPPASRARRDSVDNTGKLFIKDKGQPYLFFVQVEIRNRSKIADAIKKNGGRMESNISDADFVILGHPTTKNFEEWLRQSGYFGKIPVKPQWVLQCVEENELLELDKYVYEGFRVEKKRGRPSSMGQRYVVVADGLKAAGGDSGSDGENGKQEGTEVGYPTAAEAQRRKKAVVKRTKKGKSGEVEKKAPPKATSEEHSATSSSKGQLNAKARSPSPKHQGHWAPSPPPPTRVVEHSGGKNLYTKEDMDYFDEYIPILLARDPDMSLAAMADKLHVKMPHHTSTSWRSRLGLPARREKIARWRRRADIVNRKGDVSVMHSGGDNTQAPLPPTSGPVALTNMQQSTLAHADPFEVMAEFFANGRADSLVDAEVWKVLAHEHPQLTAEGWEAYWMEHGEAIAQEVSRQTHGRADSGADAVKSESQ